MDYWPALCEFCSDDYNYIAASRSCQQSCLCSSFLLTLHLPLEKYKNALENFPSLEKFPLCFKRIHLREDKVSPKWLEMRMFLFYYWNNCGAAVVCQVTRGQGNTEWDQCYDNSQLPRPQSQSVSSHPSVTLATSTTSTLSVLMCIFSYLFQFMRIHPRLAIFL